MKCLSACFTAIATLSVMVLLTMGGLSSASGILHSAMQEQSSSNTAEKVISSELVDHGRAAVFTGAEFSRDRLSRINVSNISRSDDRFLTLEATSGEPSGWIIQSYPSPFAGNQYARDSVNDMPIRRVANESSDKLEITPAVYQFTLESSELESSGKSSKLHTRDSAARFSF